MGISALPTGAVVEEATLRLYQMERVGTGDVSAAHMIVLATGYTYDGVNDWTPISCCLP